jgi:hypothetical protein
MFGLTSLLGGSDDDMAKNAQFIEVVVAEHMTALKRAGADQRSFNAAVEAMKMDPRFGKAEAVEVAARYVGRKVASKKAATEAIAKRFVETVRMQAKLVTAAKERPI